LGLASKRKLSQQLDELELVGDTTFANLLNGALLDNLTAPTHLVNSVSPLTRRWVRAIDKCD
jgi:hypothetical protein